MSKGLIVTIWFGGSGFYKLHDISGILKYEEDMAVAKEK